MKKLLFLSVCVALLASCGNAGKNEALKAENDSLTATLASRDAELEEIMAIFNDVQEGFRLINEAENRVDLQSGSLEGATPAQKIKEDIRFISEKLQSNREQIAKLEEQLKNSKHNSAQFKKAIANLNAELQAKAEQIETLQTELASKNIRIAELDDAVAGLTQNVADLIAENKVKSATVASQDKALNTAWFVFGTKSELKEQKIIESKFLQKTKVLSDAEFNKDYFTQIDIRTDKEIKLYSKNAELLTTHPAGSYELAKDAKEQLVLKITNPAQFWSVSRYLVILVK
jgi:chromosome segregation ATPase